MERSTKQLLLQKQTVRIQRLTHIKTAKACRTVSNEALCIINGVTPINIKIDEAAKYFAITKGEGEIYDKETDIKYWTHPAKHVSVIEAQEDSTQYSQAYTDGSEMKRVFVGGNLKTTPRYRLNERRSNNQAEQKAILKALE